MPSKVWIIAALYPRMPVIIKYVQYIYICFCGKKTSPKSVTVIIVIPIEMAFRGLLHHSKTPPNDTVPEVLMKQVPYFTDPGSDGFIALPYAASCLCVFVAVMFSVLAADVC